MPYSKKFVRKVRKSLLTSLKMEKLLWTVAFPGKTVNKSPLKSRSTGKRQPVYNHPYLDPMEKLHSSRDFLKSSSDWWSTIISSNSCSIWSIFEVDQCVRRRSQWVWTMIRKSRPRNFTSSLGSTAGRAAPSLLIEYFSADMDPMPHISFSTLRPRSIWRDQSSSASISLTHSTTKVPRSSKKPQRLSTLTPKWPLSDTIELLSAPSSSRSELQTFQTPKSSINVATNFSKASRFWDTSVVWPWIFLAEIDETL